MKLSECIAMNEAAYSPKEAWPFVNYLDTGSITDNRIKAIQRLELSKEKLPSRARRKVKPGDIVFSTVRPNQRHFGLLRDIPDNFLASTGFAVIRARDRIADPCFLYWYLAQDRIVSHLHTIAEHSTSAYPSIRPADIGSLEVNLPPLPEQRAIARVLGALDDKIELNRRMNETLEAMAQAIFKDWFVDFGPVRAKAEGRAPYLPPALWNLFPDTLDDEGKPVGWTTYKLDDLASHYRATLSPSARPNRIYEHYSIPAYDAGNEPSIDLGSSIKSNKTIVPKGAILLSKINPENKRVWLPNPSEDAPQVASTEFLALKPLAPATRSVLYCLFKSLGFRTKMTALVTGTSRSHQRVPPKSLLVCDVLAANSKMLALFDEKVVPMMTRLLTNRRESRKLAQTRDILLPKLMSGEIHLRNAEKAVEPVA
ncbi:MAG: restriction endonuclease subunit S [Gammaproteobacteria bacterium]|nr:restriction endonuclease subunit S [Gammaproteobacteria bacterium]